MAMSVRLNPAGIAAVLKSAEMTAGVHAKAEEIAGHVRSAGLMVEGIPGDVALPVEVHDASKGEAAASTVVIAHPSGLAVQAKHGSLTSGAAAAGLEVTGG